MQIDLNLHSRVSIKETFSIHFKMTPKDRKEADMIRKIIFAFKSNMTPEFVGDNQRW